MIKSFAEDKLDRVARHFNAQRINRTPSPATGEVTRGVVFYPEAWYSNLPGPFWCCWISTLLANITRRSLALLHWQRGQ
jgi:hypothetical protein